MGLECSALHENSINNYLFLSKKKKIKLMEYDLILLVIYMYACIYQYKDIKDIIFCA